MNLQTLQEITDNFVNEINLANSKEKTSLAYIIHQISPSPLVKDGEIFESIVIGGTVGKIAILKKNGNSLQILDKKQEQLSLKTEEEFLNFVDRKLLKDVDALAVNFAYPMKPIFTDEKLDGTLLAVSKEGGFQGLVGKQIGKEIEEHILLKRGKKIKVSVANDTVCLLTSGLDKFEEEKLAGGVVGTGLNFAFFLSKNKLVNLESAKFDKFPQTKTGKKVDEESSRPGVALFEKETAGAYLYKHLNIILKENNIDYPLLKSTEELDELSRKNIPHVSEIAQDLLKRSAELVACQIAGISLFKKQNMTFIMEGSLFWEGNNYKKIVDKTVKQLVPECKVDFIEIEDSSILGAAKLIS